MIDETKALIDRVVARLMSDDEAAFKSGGRTVAIQAIERRMEIVHALQYAITVLGEKDLTVYQRGYFDALLDVLVAADTKL